MKIKSESLVFAYNRCFGYLFILPFLFAYLFIISTTNNARKSIMSIACFCWFKDKKHGLPCVDFKDNRDNRDNSLNLAFANRHKPEVRAMALITYTKNAGFAAIGCSTRGYGYCLKFFLALQALFIALQALFIAILCSFHSLCLQASC